MGSIKKKSNARVVIGIAGVLCILQLGYIFLFTESDRTDIKTSIQNAVKKVNGVDGRRREQLKVQIAVNLFKAKTKNYPKSLELLIPTYLETIPVDPATGKIFSYMIENNIAYIGEDGDTVLAQQQLITSGSDSKSVLAEAAASNEMLAFVYDPSTKRDPFVPFEYAPKVDDISKTPLERYEYNELRLAAVLDGIEPPKAIIEDSMGKGYTATIGTKVGPRGGVIVTIDRKRVVVLETVEDPAGGIKTKEEEIKLRGTADEKNSGTTGAKKKPVKKK